MAIHRAATQVLLMTEMKKECEQTIFFQSREAMPPLKNSFVFKFSSP